MWLLGFRYVYWRLKIVGELLIIVYYNGGCLFFILLLCGGFDFVMVYVWNNVEVIFELEEVNVI